MLIANAMTTCFIVLASLDFHHLILESTCFVVCAMSLLCPLSKILSQVWLLFCAFLVYFKKRFDFARIESPTLVVPVQTCLNSAVTVHDSETVSKNTQTLINWMWKSLWTKVKPTFFLLVFGDPSCTVMMHLSCENRTLAEYLNLFNEVCKSRKTFHSKRKQNTLE